MGLKEQANTDPIAEPKKRRRVGFSKVDNVVEAKECFTIYMVSRKEEVGTSDGFRITPVDLNSFFEEDGKIYGYQDLKITVWLSSISFQAYAEVTFQRTSDGGKGITDVKSALQSIFGDTLVVNKDDFLQTFSKESHYISSMVSEGERLQDKACNGDMSRINCGAEVSTSDVEIIRMRATDLAAGILYSRLVPLVFLLVEGSNPIDVTDPNWELYILIQKKTDQQETRFLLLGFAAVYRFYHYPDSSRIRLSQILVLPPFQHKGYGSYLVQVLSNTAVAENAYDWTVEEPLDYFQHVRTRFDVKRLLAFEPIQNAVKSAVANLTLGKMSETTRSSQSMPLQNVVEQVRKVLKINKKQFLRCWEILLYLGLDPADRYMEDYVMLISHRVKADVLGNDSETAGKRVINVPSLNDEEASFVMFKKSCDDGVQMDKDQMKIQEQQLQQLVDERVKEVKLVAQKLSNR